MRAKLTNLPSHYKTVFTEEWRAAKRILAPALNGVKRPRLYAAKQVSQNLGWHFGGRGTTMVRLVGRRWLRNGNVIMLRLGQEDERLRQTIRHEICHVVYQDHSPKFHNLLNLLVRERKAAHSVEARLTTLE